VRRPALSISPSEPAAPATTATRATARRRPKGLVKTEADSYPPRSEAAFPVCDTPHQAGLQAHREGTRQVMPESGTNHPAGAEVRRAVR
jgi:hypothetical protein